MIALKNLWLKRLIFTPHHTKPIILEVYLVDNSYKKILFKKEDVRFDYIICRIISFFKNIITDNNSFINYDIIPININSGLIEIVDKSNTLYYIKEELNISLQNYSGIQHDKNFWEFVQYYSNNKIIYFILFLAFGHQNT